MDKVMVDAYGRVGLLPEKITFQWEGDPGVIALQALHELEKLTGLRYVRCYHPLELSLTMLRKGPVVRTIRKGYEQHISCSDLQDGYAVFAKELMYFTQALINLYNEGF